MARGKRLTWGLRTVLCVAVALALTGCADEPAVEESDANQAIAAAREAQAETYAPDQMNIALDTLTAARTELETQRGRFFLFRGFDEARRLLLLTKDLADSAQVLAVVGSSGIAEECRTMLAGAQALVTECEGLIAAAPKGKGTKADLVLIRSDLDAVRSLVTDADRELTANRFEMAKARLGTALDKAGALKAELEKVRRRGRR